MGAIIFEVTMLVLVVAFVLYLALDDRRNQKIREEEDRLKALEDAKKSKQDGDNSGGDVNS